MLKFDLELPYVASNLLFNKSTLLNNYEIVKQLVKKNKDIKQSVPSLFQPLLKSSLIHIEKSFEPGLSKITWNSTQIENFVKNLTKVLNDFEFFVRKVILQKLKRMKKVSSIVITNNNRAKSY